MKQSIKDLIKAYIDVVNSPENEKNKQYWSRVYEWNRDMWRGIPVKGNKIPFTVAPDNSLWSKILGFDLREYYNNPETYLETQIKMKLYHFENFKDNTYFTDELFIWFGVITELSYFNVDLVFYSNKEGWINGSKINDYKNLDEIEEPDFYKSGLMPKIHNYYEVLNEYASGQLKVMFPEWVRGPFCIAAHLRGLQNILMDTVLEQENLHRLMRFVVNSNFKWNEERNKFLQTKIRTCKLYNDEIESPTISPNIYKEFIFPYEKEIADNYGEVSYWHSCGNTTDFIEPVGCLPNLRLFHCGPWTSYKKAVEVFGDRVALDICLNPEKDVLQANDEQMIAKLKEIKSSCKDVPYFVRADAFMGEFDNTYKLLKINDWCKIASRYLNFQDQ